MLKSEREFFPRFVSGKFLLWAVQHIAGTNMVGFFVCSKCLKKKYFARKRLLQAVLFVAGLLEIYCVICLAFFYLFLTFFMLEQIFLFKLKLS